MLIIFAVWKLLLKQYFIRWHSSIQYIVSRVWTSDILIHSWWLMVLRASQAQIVVVSIFEVWQMSPLLTMLGQNYPLSALTSTLVSACYHLQHWLCITISNFGHVSYILILLHHWADPGWSRKCDVDLLSASLLVSHGWWLIQDCNNITMNNETLWLNIYENILQYQQPHIRLLLPTNTNNQNMISYLFYKLHYSWTNNMSS